MKSTLLALIALVLCACGPAESKPLPQNSYRYKAIVIKEGRAAWGVDAPTALFAAQIHQESTWRPDAVSPAGARGLAQFTTPTLSDMVRWYRQRLGEKDDAFNPVWSIRALVLYDLRIYSSLKPQSAPELRSCDRWAMTLSGYNGGPGWVSRDRRLAAERGADPDLWWGHTELHSNRADWAFKENRAYPRKILYEHEPLYLTHGWKGERTCG